MRSRQFARRPLWSMPLVAALALPLYSHLSTSDVPFTVFALFLAVSLSVTAFPVLARILTDRGISRTELGTLALSLRSIADNSADDSKTTEESEARRNVNVVRFGVGHTTTPR